MSLKATLEILVHLQNFRNIDLFQQGVYQFRVTITHTATDNAQYNESRPSQPYMILEDKDRRPVYPNSQQIRQFANNNVIQQSRLQDLQFLSKAFLIKYCDEQVDINDACVFRSEIDSLTNFNNQNIFLKIELLFTELTTLTLEDYKPARLKYFMQPISSFQSKINNFYRGIKEFVPVIFDEMHFCYLKMTVHTLLIDFKYRYQIQSGKQIQQETFDQYFKRVTDNFQKDQVDTFYQTYVKILKTSHRIFLKYYRIISEECINNAQMKAKYQSVNFSVHFPCFVKRETNATKNDQNGPQQNLKVNENKQEIAAIEQIDIDDEDTLDQKIHQELQVDALHQFVNHVTNKKQKSQQSQQSQLTQQQYERLKLKLKVKTECEESKLPLSKERIQSELDLNIQQKLCGEQILNISDYFDLTNPNEQQELTNALSLEINQLSCCLFQVWYIFLESFEFFSKDLTKKLELEYLVKIKDRWGESIFQNTIIVKDFAEFQEQKIGRKHKEVAKQIRNNQYYQYLEPLNIEDLNLFPKASIHPIVFKEVYIKDNASLQPIKSQKYIIGLHLYVLAHGFQGNSFDMRQWKNTIAVKYPEHLQLSTSSNEDKTGEDIVSLGHRLANEIKKWIREWCPKENFAKISFIGHSLGGLIIRAALPELEKYKEKMHSIITLAVPHLGYFLSSSKMVDSGLWFIKKIKKQLSLNQLTFSDARNHEETCIYKLSLFQGLGWFKNIVLVSSYQDSYIPFESARMQRSSKLTGEQQYYQHNHKMIDNIMNQITNDRIQRIDVNYEIPGKYIIYFQIFPSGIDNMIGRAAHIAFLDNQALIKLFVEYFEEYFE